MHKATKEHIQSLLSLIYNKGINAVIPKTRLDAIFDYHKKNFNNTDGKYWNDMPDDITKDIESVSVIKELLTRYLEDKRAIQSGVLTECVVSKAVADALGATTLTTVFEKSPQNLPVDKNITKALKNKTVRFAYTVDGIEDILVAQCGGNKTGDLLVFYKGIEYKFEIKGTGAKAGEHDCLYTDEGKLIARKRTPKQSKYLVSACDGLDIWQYVGHNYLFSKEVGQEAFNLYLASNKIDIYATVDKEGKVVLACSEDLNELGILTFEGSEMRMGGRNHENVFTVKYFEKVISELEANISNDGIVIISKEKMTPAKGRGKETISRWKLNSVFFVYAEDCTVENETVSFYIDDVRQLRPTVSTHVGFVGNVDDVVKFYKELDVDEL